MKVIAKFSDSFMCTDQDVKDISAAKPETNWSLIELPADQLEILEKGGAFYFQSQNGGTGVDDGGANLYTEHVTFGLEFLENSNSQFVACITDSAGDLPADGASIEGMDVDVLKGQQCEVFGQVRGHILTKPIQVNVQRVRALLAKQPLGVELNSGSDSNPLTMRDLQYEVAASPAELSALLESGPFVVVDGVWRLIPTALESEILDTAVNVVSAKGWSPESVNIEALLVEVQSLLGKLAVPTAAVLRKVLRCLLVDAKLATETAKDSSTEGDDSKTQATEIAETKVDTTSSDLAGAVVNAGMATEPPTHLQLDKEKVSRFKVLQVLQMPPAKVRDRFGLGAPEPRQKRARITVGRPAPVDTSGGPPLTVDEFVAVLQELTGATEKPTHDDVWKVVGNDAYADEFEGTIHGLDHRSLPQDPRERLARLFQLQSHWKPSRIASLIQPVLAPGFKVDVWLLKQARAAFVEIEQGKEERFLVKKFGN